MLLVWDYGFSPMPMNNRAGEELVYIPPGTGLQGIRQVLVEAGMIRDDIRFVLLARLMGNAKRLRAGEYRLAKGVNPLSDSEDFGGRQNSPAPGDHPGRR